MDERATAATSPPASRMIISTVRKPLPPFSRIEAIRASTLELLSHLQGAAILVCLAAVDDPAKVQSEHGVSDDLREQGELRGREDGRRHARRPAEQFAEGAHQLLGDLEADRLVGCSFGGRVHAGTLPGGSERGKRIGACVGRALGLGFGGMADAHQRITVLIADDHRAFGEALGLALEKEVDLEVLEVTADGATAAASAASNRPDVALIDFRCPTSTAWRRRAGSGRRLPKRR